MTRAGLLFGAFLALGLPAQAEPRDALDVLVARGALPAGVVVTRDEVVGDAREVTLAWPVSGRPDVDEAALDALLQVFRPGPDARGLRLYVAVPGGRLALRDLLPPVTPVAPKPGEPPAASAPAPLPVVVPVSAPGGRTGALSGKHVYVSQGHGWTWTDYGWRTQRGNTWGVVEDFLNAEGADQYLLRYLHNAGATVWPMREPDLNPAMVIVDDGDGASDPAHGTYEEAGEGFATSTAPGFANVAPPWDSGDDVMTAGSSRYHYTAVEAEALARFTPNLPAAGRYHVYASWSASQNRASDAHLRVRHAGGEANLRVDQKRHGNTWVDLGEYVFAAGHDPEHGSVEVLNDSADAPGQTVVVTDAVRFGGGQGLIRRGTGAGGSDQAPTSGKPRWQENCRYSAQFNGAPPDVYDYRDADGSDDVVARSRYAAWQHEAGEDAVYVSWHTNAPSPGRGTSTFVYGPSDWGDFSESLGVAGSDRLAELLHAEVLNDVRHGYDPAWKDAGLHSAWFGEVNPDHNPEMPSALIEVGFHDTEDECHQMQDPKFRNVAARALYQAVERYFAEKAGVAPVFVPEPPHAFRVTSTGPDRARLSWAAPVTDAEGVLGDAATGYVLYRSTDGRAFDGGKVLAAQTSVEVDAAPGVVHYFRLTATNAGGESFATPMLALSQPAAGQRPALLVGAFDRLDRFAQIGEDLSAWDDGIVQHMLLDRMNAYDYLVPHAEALAALGLPFESAWHDAPLAVEDLAAHAFVVWAAGEESTADESFSDAELALVEAYVAAGGVLVASGSEIGWDLVEAGLDDQPQRFRDLFSADYVADDAATYALTLADGTEASFDDGTHGAYDVDYPDVLAPLGQAVPFATYGAGGPVAGVWAPKPSGGGVALLGVPFEAVQPAEARLALLQELADALALAERLDAPDEPPDAPGPEPVEASEGLEGLEVHDEAAPDPGDDPGPDPAAEVGAERAEGSPDVRTEADEAGSGGGGSCAVGDAKACGFALLNLLVALTIVASRLSFRARKGTR